MNQNSSNSEMIAMETWKHEYAIFGALFCPEGLKICIHIDNEVEPFWPQKILKGIGFHGNQPVVMATKKKGHQEEILTFSHLNGCENLKINDLEWV